MPDQHLSNNGRLTVAVRYARLHPRKQPEGTYFLFSPNLAVGAYLAFDIVAVGQGKSLLLGRGNHCVFVPRACCRHHRP